MIVDGVEPGIYSIWLGDQNIGELQMPPALGAQPIECLDAATRRSLLHPTPTPRPTLWPGYPDPVKLPVPDPYPVATPAIVPNPSIARNLRPRAIIETRRHRDAAG